jgi:5-methylcytosine-specific restriction endonuclease McrBC GTP-binding regulatory subunit McrB
MPKREKKNNSILEKESSIYIGKMTEKPRQSEKRNGLNQSMPKEFVNLAGNRVPESVCTVINIYQLFKQLGYSESKIYAFAKSACRGKKDV